MSADNDTKTVDWHEGGPYWYKWEYDLLKQGRHSSSCIPVHVPSHVVIQKAFQLESPQSDQMASFKKDPINQKVCVRTRRAR